MLVQGGLFFTWKLPVIQQCLATRFGDSQSGVNIFDDEYFGSIELGLILFISCDHVWNKSYQFQEYQGSPISRLRFCQAVQELVESERDIKLDKAYLSKDSGRKFIMEKTRIFCASPSHVWYTLWPGPYATLWLHTASLPSQPTPPSALWT